LATISFVETTCLIPTPCYAHIIDSPAETLKLSRRYTRSIWSEGLGQKFYSE